MRWSTRFTLAGALFFVLGVGSVLLRDISVDSITGAVTFVGTGLLLVFIGLLLRKVRKSFG